MTFDEMNRKSREADEEAGRKLLLIRFEQAKAILLAISTDIGQDRLEDPIGFHEREAMGLYRIGKGSVDKLNKLLSHIEGAGA